MTSLSSIIPSPNPRAMIDQDLIHRSFVDERDFARWRDLDRLALRARADGKWRGRSVNGLRWLDSQLRSWLGTDAVDRLAHGWVGSLAWKARGSLVRDPGLGDSGLLDVGDLDVRWHSRYDSKLAEEFFLSNRALHLNLVLNSPAADPSLMDLLIQWRQTCDTEHGCTAKSDWRPTRLISVGTPDRPHLRLLNTEPIRGELVDNGKYLALSHRWGEPDEEDVKLFCTTTFNIDQRVIDFSFDELPATFQDAVLVTRGMDYRSFPALLVGFARSWI
jgi:hypothetical protein